MYRLSRGAVHLLSFCTPFLAEAPAMLSTRSVFFVFPLLFYFNCHIQLRISCSKAVHVSIHVSNRFGSASDLLTFLVQTQCSQVLYYLAVPRQKSLLLLRGHIQPHFTLYWIARKWDNAEHLLKFENACVKSKSG